MTCFVRDVTLRLDGSVLVLSYLDEEVGKQDTAILLCQLRFPPSYGQILYSTIVEVGGSYVREDIEGVLTFDYVVNDRDKKSYVLDHLAKEIKREFTKEKIRAA